MATFSLQLFITILPSIVSVLLLILVPLLVVIYKIKLFVPKHEREWSKPVPPEAGGAWPIIGHLHLLGGKLQLPHKLLAQMADEHGPVFRLKIGVQKAIVVSSSELAKECFVLNDKALTSRPRLLVVDIMGYGNASIFPTPYGPYWRSLRKVVSLELLSNHRLDMLSHVWREEASVCINKLYGFWFKHKKISLDGVLVEDLKQWFSRLSMRIIVRIVSGKSLYVGREEEEEEIMQPLQETIEDLFNRIGSFFIGDALPFLRWLDLGGQEKAMKKTAEKMDAILEAWLQEHKQMRSSGSQKCGNDFMSVMLSILEGSNDINACFDDDTINKATCLAMIAGASDTSSVVLTWAMSLLLNNRGVLKKAQDEMNTCVGKDRRVTESDMSKLVYLQAIVKETLRKYPPAPLSAPREFNEDCIVGGYHVEKGTRLIVNISKIQCDPRVWEDPMEFRPERFLTTHKDVNVKGRSFELIPFGSGRRMCPGVSFGIRNAQFLLASFLQAFEFSTVDDALVDMTESFGLTNMKATPLQVLIAPRLSVHLYDPI